MYELRLYISPERKDPFLEGLLKLRDTKARIAIDHRVELGNFGDHKFCRDGVWELRVDVGAGYRIYYAIADQRIVLLLTVGDKRSQDSDINAACAYWQDWQRRPQ
jgi:putative addiction module killer protein